MNRTFNAIKLDFYAGKSMIMMSAFLMIIAIVIGVVAHGPEYGMILMMVFGVTSCGSVFISFTRAKKSDIDTDFLGRNTMPRYMIIVAVVAVIIIFSAIRLAIKSSSHHFKCPGYGENFQVSFFKYMFTAHSIDGKCSVSCPKCRKTNMLAPISGKK